MRRSVLEQQGIRPLELVARETTRTLESESFLIEMAERTQIQLQAVTHMFFSQAVPVQISRSARLRLENARRSYRSSFCNLGRT